MLASVFGILSSPRVNEIAVGGIRDSRLGLMIPAKRNDHPLIASVFASHGHRFVDICGDGVRVGG